MFSYSALTLTLIDNYEGLTINNLILSGIRSQVDHLNNYFHKIFIKKKTRLLNCVVHFFSFLAFTKIQHCIIAYTCKQKAKGTLPYDKVKNIVSYELQADQELVINRMPLKSTEK